MSINYLITKDRNVLTNWNSFSEAKLKPENETNLRLGTKHWIGTRLEFEGGHASKFYQMIKENPLNWKRMNLDNTNLGRIDLYYDRKLKESDRVEDFEAFLSDAAETISSGSRSLVVDLKPQALRIGHRKTSPNFFRIYKKSNGKFIRFELEMKLETAKSFQFFLFAGQFETLESKLIQHYYSYIITKFEIQRSCYTDWMLENFRNIRVLQIPKNSLVTTYLMNRLDNRLTDQEFLYKLFQLLSYIRQLDYSFGFIVDQEYLIITFKFTDFLEFIGANKNHYQVQKVGKFLKYLQTLPPMLSTLSNICFQSINIFPYLKVFKKKSVMMPLPPVAIHRLSPMEQDRILSNKKGYPQIATIPESKVDKIRLTNDQIKQFNNLALQLNSGSITMEEAVLRLRGGDGLTDVVAVIAFVIFINWYDSLFGVEAFQANPLPHQDPFGWLNGKYDRKPMQHTSYKSSRFELQMAGVNDNMCPGLAMADENGFVMSYQEAHNLVAETYPGYLEVNESCKITDWQAAKHIYHANGMGIDTADYGFTQQELERIRGESRYKGGGLIAYARRGYRLPPIEMVQDYQLRLKASCKKAPIKRTKVPYYDVNGSWQATVFATPPSEDSSGIIVAFNESTGDLITGDKQKTPAFNRFKNENYLGGKKWMLKWSNK